MSCKNPTWLSGWNKVKNGKPGKTEPTVRVSTYKAVAITCNNQYSMFPGTVSLRRAVLNLLVRGPKINQRGRYTKIFFFVLFFLLSLNFFLQFSWETLDTAASFTPNLNNMRLKMRPWLNFSQLMCFVWVTINGWFYSRYGVQNCPNFISLP